MLRVAGAFIRRDFLIWISYRLSFVWQLLTMVGGAVALYIVGNVAQSGMEAQLDRYGGSYFAFILVSFGFVQFLGAISSSFNDAVRDGQTTGTLEVILTSPHRLPTILLGSTGFYLLIGSLRLMIVFAIGRFAFGLWETMNLAAVVVTMALSAVSFGAIGLIGASFTLAFKRGDPILGIYGLLNAAFGGLAFPIEMLPEWLRPVSLLLPLTHALEAMRQSLNNQPLDAILPAWIGLTILAAVLVPLGIGLFRWAYNYARDRGSLVQY